MPPASPAVPAASTSPLTAVQASRFAQRWLDAAPERPAQLEALSALSLGGPEFRARLGGLLTRELDLGLPLERAMRRVRNLLVSSIIGRDLAGLADLDEVVTAMTEFADFAIQTHVAALMDEMVAAHGMPTGEESGRPQHLMVLAMGKQGGGELNVSSDIDLIFVYPEDGETAAGPGQRQLSNHEFFVRMGRRLNAALSEVIEDGFTFRVDMALRPNGKSGPLAASLNMVEEYLIVQGREWERYAWVKARAVTGELDDIAALDAIVRPFVFRRYLDFGVIDAIRNMHAQIRAEVKRQERQHPERSHNVKLGRGGIREIEFLAQVFQLIRGGRDPALREKSTRKTLRLLAERDLLAPDTVEQLLDAYTFLRNLEHRVQYLEDAQTHTLPTNEADRLAVARMMGCEDEATLLARLERQRSFVAQQFDAIFADKETPDQDPDTPGLGDELDNVDALAARLHTLGFDDARTAAARLAATLQGPRLGSLPDASRARRHSITHITLHHQGETFKPGTDVHKYLRNLQTWSRNTKGWLDIPYHYVIDLEGHTYAARDIAYAGDTNTEYDPKGHALIEVVGNFEEVEPNQQQLDAVVALMASLAAQYGVPVENIASHRDHSDKTVCPGANLYRYVQSGYFREQVATKLGAK